MDDYIRREKAIEKIRFEGIYGDGYSDEELENGIVGMIESIPAADVKPVVYGKWVFIGDNMFECSNCCTPYTKEQLSSWKRFKYDSDFPNYCPNCGSVNKGATSYG